jgi:hypothetical protein
MRRLFFILIVIALVFWCAERYLVAHLHGGGFWDFAVSHLVSAKPDATVATSPPERRTIADCRSALQSLSQTTLGPLRDGNDFSASEAARILQNTQRDLGEYRSHPDYAHLMQGCDLIARALQDRQVITERWQRAKTMPSGTPATSLKAAGNLSGYTGSPILGSTGNFFEQRVLKDWEERCDYYKPLLDRALIPSS